MKEKLVNLHELFKKYHIYFYLIMVGLIALDLTTKYVMEAILLDAPNHRIEVIDGFFTLSLVYNPGAFSGMLGDSIFGRIILMLLSLICGVVMLWYFIKSFSKMGKLELFGITLAIPGTLGNLWDRTLQVFGLQEGVIDFLEFDLGFMVWNTFNIADSLLVIGIIAFAVGYLIRDSKEEKKKEQERLKFYEEKKNEEEELKDE